MWVPPPDPDKPVCPYLPGFEADISAHTAPPPFGGDYATAPYPFRTEEWLNSVSQTKHIVTYPPLETQVPTTKPRTARLVVTRSLAVGNARGPQVLVCSVTLYGEHENQATFEAVAKIYDPLYYSFVSDIGSYPSDVVLRADKDYTQEAATYEHLTRAGQTGFFAPAYFGSWTFNAPVSYNGETRQRSIRLILIEHLAGICMRDLFVNNGPHQIDATHLNRAYRLHVLAMLLDGIVKQHHVGVDQRDLAPRNVFLIPPPRLTQELAQEPPRRVVLIDYNASAVWDLTKRGKRAVQLARLPPNPMKRFWRTSLSELAGWAPAEFSHPRSFQEWLCQEFGGERKAAYEPVLEDLAFHEPDLQNLVGDLPPEGKVQQSSRSKAPSEGQGGFEVVRAPAMLEGERPAPTSGPLFDLVRARMKALEMGQCQEKY